MLTIVLYGFHSDFFLKKIIEKNTEIWNHGDPQFDVGSTPLSYHLWVSISQIMQISVLIGEKSA